MDEPYFNKYVKQNVGLEFYPSKGELVLHCNGASKSFDMKDVFILHGWLGSMIMHYIDECKTGQSKHSKNIRSIMKAANKMAETKQIEGK